MKRLLCFFLLLLNVIGLSACSDLTGGLTEYEIEQFVVEALYDEIDSTFPDADAGSCRYKINKTDEKGDFIYVYGTVMLYDKYGKQTTGWSNDRSVPRQRTYEVIIHQNGYIKDCDID